LLSKRGLSAETITYFSLRPSIGGWEYPVARDLPTRRWKAFPHQQGPKYLWLPDKPDALRFYDPHGDLAERTAAANGTLILASGEADVWALYEGHITNTTATMLGEGTIPAWLVDELHRLHVRIIQIWPDRDETGQRAALKLRDLLAGTGIALEIYELPYEFGSKGDIGQLLIDVGAANLQQVLTACPCQILPNPAPVRQPSAYTPPADVTNLYEQWCIEVERAAVAAWNISEPNSKNLSRKNFKSPFREDKRPSAQWNYTAHGFKDYATGEFYNTHTVADLLGLPSWEDTKPVYTPAANTAVRYFKRGVPEKFIALLLNLHGDTWLNPKRGTLPNLGAAAVTYYAWMELIQCGIVSEREAVTAKSLARDSLRQISEDTAQRGIEQLVEWDLADFLHLVKDPKEIRAETPLIQSRRGPKGRQVMLRPLQDAIPALLKKLEQPLLARVLITDYPDLPVRASLLAEALADIGLTPDQIEQIDAQSEALYTENRALTQRARQEFQRRRAIFQAKYGLEALLCDQPLILPEGVLTPNASVFRDVVDNAHLEAVGGVRNNRYEAARAVGRSMSAHRASCARREIVIVPQYQEHTLDPKGQDIASQCAALDPQAFARGSMELIAPDGSSTWVSENRADSLDFDGWAANREGNLPLTLRIRKTSIEKHKAQATAEDIEAQEIVSERQRSLHQRRKSKIAPADASSTSWPEAYLLRQGELRAPLFGITLLPDGRFADRFGEIHERDARTLWHCLVEPDPPPLSEQAPAHICCICSEPAPFMEWSGWYCETHYELPLNEKRRLWPRVLPFD
jgi:hypothetical protein